MSSWANRNIPRKRDITQIPVELRPQIIPRAQRAEVITSESFQAKLENEIVIPTSSLSDTKKEYINPRQYVTKKIEAVNLSAFELKYDDKSYVFVILRHLRNVRDNDLWISSYNSIRKFYTNKIIIIDDNSSINTVNGKLINTEVIQSEFPGAGEILPYYYFLKYKWADRMIFLHDSMFIYRPFRDSELEDQIKFHWHFSQNEIIDYRKLSIFVSFLNNSTELDLFIKNPNSKWKGCFGVTSICDLNILENLENKYNIFSRLSLVIKTRKDRESFERFFGIVLFFENIIDENCSNFGNIMTYPGAYESNNNNFETAVHVLKQTGYNTAIIKVWRGR